MKNLPVFFFLLLLAGCEKQIDLSSGSTTPGNYSPIIPQHSILLRVRDSLDITLNLAVNDISKSSYYWSCNYGKVEGHDGKITYFSPELPGVATIKVTVSDGYVTKTDSTRITVFKQLAIIKADDLVYTPDKIVSDNWKQFIDYVISRKIKAGLGLIAKSLEAGNAQYYSYLKNIVATGYIELWNHGYNHVINGIDSNGKTFDEFQKSNYEYQLEHLLRAQNLTKEKLGITMTSFGAPGNDIDETTRKALDAVPELKMWFFGLKDENKLVLNPAIDVEHPTFYPDYDKFVSHFRFNSENTYLVLQVHPNSWDDKHFAEFWKIVDFLNSKNVTFITPSDYYNIVNKTQN